LRDGGVLIPSPHMPPPFSTANLQRAAVRNSIRLHTALGYAPCGRGTSAPRTVPAVSVRPLGAERRSKMVNSTRHLRVVGLQREEHPASEQSLIVPRPNPEWPPLRRAAFSVYERTFRSAHPNRDWVETWEYDETEKLRSAGTEFSSHSVFVLAGRPCDTSDARDIDRITLSADDLSQGPNHIEKLLQSHFSKDELSQAITWTSYYWLTITKYLLQSIELAAVQLYARVGSPLASFVHIPGDAFAHYKVIDWRKGVAECTAAPSLFCPHIDFGEMPPTGQHVAKGTSPALPPERKRKRKPVILQYTVDFLGKHHPGGPPPGVTLKELAKEVDPPPLEWSILNYGFRAERGSPRWVRRDTSPRRLLRSCARWMFWSRRGRRWRMRSAPSG